MLPSSFTMCSAAMKATALAVSARSAEQAAESAPRTTGAEAIVRVYDTATADFSELRQLVWEP